MSEKVGIVLVSHSADLAAGLAELAGQMAGSVTLATAGGTDDGGIGTSFAKVSAAVAGANTGAGVVVVSDLGSALLTAETVLDMLPEEERASVAVVDVPFVEGGIAAAVEAESGADLAGVVRAAESARSAWADAASSAGSPPPAAAAGPIASTQAEGPYVRDVVVRNREGLHARPAAEFVKLANTFGARVTVNGKDAKSLLGIMSLGLTAGATAQIASADADGVEAVDALAALVDTGFGEA
jgi:PTS hybrid protein